MHCLPRRPARDERFFLSHRKFFASFAFVRRAFAPNDMRRFFRRELCASYDEVCRASPRAPGSQIKRRPFPAAFAPFGVFANSRCFLPFSPYPGGLGTAAFSALPRMARSFIRRYDEGEKIRNPQKKELTKRPASVTLHTITVCDDRAARFPKVRQRAANC